MYGYRNILALSRSHICHGRATVHSL